MLPPDSRAILLQQLAPPPGHGFQGAIATTFTLDLTATLVPALAFSSFSYAGSAPDPLALLESIRQAGDRVDIFCQGGNIAVPHRAPDLLAFLEPMVHEVRRPRGGLFHPKVWFIKYADPDGVPSYRLLILTRNLANDSSWDLAVRLDSADVDTRPRRQNAALGDFLGSLAARAIRPLAPERAARISELAEEARRLHWQAPDTVEDLAFHYLNENTSFNGGFDGRRHLVVSPFVTDGGLDLISPSEITILSRAEELEKLDPATIERLDAHIIDTMAVVTESDEGSLLGHLHAKMYVIEPHGRAQKARVLIGSANATDVAFSRNVEFMVEFIGPRKHLGVDAFLGPDAPFRTLVAQYDPTGGAAPDPSEEEQKRLENALRSIAEIGHVVDVTAAGSESGTPSLHILRMSAAKAYPIPPDWSAEVGLMTRPQRAVSVPAGQVLSAEIPGVTTADVTPFLVVRLSTGSGLAAACAVIADLVNAPAHRLDVILARQIDTPEKFLRFLYLLLSLGDPSLLASFDRSTASAGSAFSGFDFGVLEMILRALTDRPAALDDLDRLVTRLEATEAGRDILPAGFDRLWPLVRKAAKDLTGGKRR